MDLAAYNVQETPRVSPSQYEAVMRGLSRCKSSYQNHVKEMGGVRRQDVAAWCEAVCRMSDQQIDVAFASHCRVKTYWPKFADIVSPEGRTARDAWKASDTQGDVGFEHLPDGTVKVVTGLSVPRISGSANPRKRSPETQAKWEVLMEALQGDEQQQARRRASQAKEHMREVRRNGGSRRSPKDSTLQQIAEVMDDVKKQSSVAVPRQPSYDEILESESLLTVQQRKPGD